MERIYIENDNARITKRENDFHLDVELYSGEVFENVEARRLFPTTGPDKYITLLNEDGKETAVIRDLNSLMPDSASAVRTALEEYYLIPRIRTITKVESKPGGNYIHAETDRGSCSFKVQSRQQDIKVLFDCRVLIRDSNDNRYEIPDFRLLDRKSRDSLQL
ncbi:MAG: DUF1854 domain-containing protein [Clostridia bacterium]|nr:DUF1854 domain-containing protein [Clostridia bacterium]